MKPLLNFAILLVAGISVLVADEAHTRPQKDPKENFVVEAYEVYIPGTTLFTSTIVHTQLKSGWSQRTCSIGYQRQNAELTSWTFTPILTLPAIENDSYVVNSSEGAISVTTKLGGKEVVKLNLEALAPTAVTRIISAEAGAAQPATKPADKLLERDQPSTPTSKDAPR